MTDHSDSIAARIEAAAAPIAEELGLYVYDVEAGTSAGCTVRLIVDRAGAGGEAGAGVTIAEVTRIAKQVGYLIDTEDLVPFAHRFEVSSPGIERSLRTVKHFEQAVDATVRVVCDPAMVGGDAVVLGVLEGADAQKLTIRPDDGDVVEVPFDAVRRARTVYDFDAGKPAKRSKGR